jgi:hypothetical protein
MGAILPLSYPSSWTPFGELTPDESAQVMLDVIWEAYEDDAQICTIDAPFYDDLDTIDDEEPEATQTWYDELSDWIIEGFLAVTFTPAAAITYAATIPKIRLAIKKGDAGGIIRVVFGSIDILYDTYAASPEIVYLDLEA